MQEIIDSFDSEAVTNAFNFLVNDTDIQGLIDKLDKNKDGVISKDELLEGTESIFYDLVYEDALSDPEAWLKKNQNKDS